MSPHSGYNCASIRAVILAGNRDFGRCPLASRVPPALWPVGEKPALLHLLDNIRQEGINSAVICSNGQRNLFQKAVTNSFFPGLEFLEEPLPLGTAGCIRDAAAHAPEEFFLIISGQMFLFPSLKKLIESHFSSKAALTIASDSGNKSSWEIYLCSRSVLKQIPEKGYFDIKESLIPALLKAGKIIRALNLYETTPGIFRNRLEYLKTIKKYLTNHKEFIKHLPGNMVYQSEDVWISDSAQIDSSVILNGPAVILSNCVISADTLIFGPTIIGPGVSVGQNTIIQNSVIWKGVQVGKNCNIANCVVDYNIKVSNGRVIKNQSVVQNTYHNAQNIKSAATSFMADFLFKQKSVFS
jgi:NDP-sugar pyrophosphorylase family protein